MGKGDQTVTIQEFSEFENCAEASFRTEMLLLFVLKSEIVAIFEITMIKVCVAFLCLYLCVTGFLSI